MVKQCEKTPTSCELSSSKRVKVLIRGAPDLLRSEGRRGQTQRAQDDLLCGKPGEGVGRSEPISPRLSSCFFFCFSTSFDIHTWSRKRKKTTNE